MDPQQTRTTGRPRKAVPARLDMVVQGNRRARILEAAGRRFAATGFEQTTVRQIADDVNILSGSLYHHFATKEEMLHEIVGETIIRMRDTSRTIAKAGTDAERRLVALILFNLREMTRDSTVHAILYHERKFFRRSPDFRYVIEGKKAAFDAWSTIVRDGIDQALFNPGIDIFFTIHTIVRLLNTAADWYNDEDGGLRQGDAGSHLERVTDFHLAFILNAIRARGRVWDPVPEVDTDRLAAASSA